MKLRFKLLFPIIAGYGALAILLHYLWIPLLLSDAQKNYQKNEQLMLSGMESEIIRDLISDDMASLSSFLDAQMEVHTNDWKTLKISDIEGNQVYPLETIEIADSITANSDNNLTIIKIHHELEYLDNSFGSIWLLADWGGDRAAILLRFRQLEIYMLLTFGVIILISIFWQNMKISNPIKLLTSSASQWAKGDFSITLPNLGHDEIGQLATTFNSMVQMRQRYEEELEQLTQQTILSLSELTEQKFVLDQHAIVTATDVQGNITYANDKFCEISGYSRDELQGQNHRIINSGIHDQTFFKNMYQTISRGKVWRGEICIRDKEGHLHWMDTTIAPFMGDNGKPRSFIAIRTDISEQKKTENELINAKNMAEDAALAKSEFLASMSHEIRTPMNGVLGMLSLLENTLLNEEQQHRLNIAQSSAQSLLTLINDILDFSKIDAGKIELEILDFDLRSMLGELAEAMGHQAQNKNLELVLEVTGIEASMVKGDPTRLRQIITNIISNAIKFTSQGEIVIQANLQTIDEQHWQLNCEIRDTGIGIPTDKLPGLFDSFSQVDSSTTRQYGGTGLGLTIVKKLCELMNGDIQVSSEPGKGSCFAFNICLQKSDLSQLVLPSVDMKSLHLLIVDDNTINREVLCGQLQHWGADVVEAVSGKQALELCEQYFHEQRPFDIAFLDMQMPEMDGVELGQRLQSDSRFNKIKLIMMTSMGIQGDASYFAELGFSGYFPKPATTSDLFDALTVISEGGIVLQQANPLVTSHYLKALVHEQKKDHDWPPNTRLLLVEDNKINQMVAEGILEKLDLQPGIAENGVQALEKLQQSLLENNPYTMVLMDCQMPEMDGYEASQQIRAGKAGEQNREIPIIAMTANVMAGDKEKCLQAGMDDYLPKPIDANLLLNKLQHWIISNGSSSRMEDNDDTTHDQKMASEANTWDQEAALKRLMGKTELLKKLLQVFFEETPGRMASLAQAIDTKDCEQVRHIAHTIKGVAANLSGLQLQDHAARMEAAAKEKNMSQLIQLMPELKKKNRQLEQCFEKYCKEMDN